MVACGVETECLNFFFRKRALLMVTEILLRLHSICFALPVSQRGYWGRRAMCRISTDGVNHQWQRRHDKRIRAIIGVISPSLARKYSISPLMQKLLITYCIHINLREGTKLLRGLRTQHISQRRHDAFHVNFALKSLNLSNLMECNHFSPKLYIFLLIIGT